MSTAASPAAGLQPVLAAWGAAGSELSPLGAGLINQTYAVEGPRGRFVLQRLHPVFRPEVNLDIDAVTRYLAAQGLLTPRLLRTVTGDCWFGHDGQTWRALSWVDGRGIERVADAGQAAEAGRVLARFHDAMQGFEHRFHGSRSGVHDTARHLARLREALARHRGHRRYRCIEPLAGRILAAAAALPVLPPVPERVVHGDPKIGNILFSHDQRRALCLIDFDTLAPMALPLELGDAFRSWCNPAGEDGPRAFFSLEIFRAALTAYAELTRGFLLAAEWGSIVAATRTIQVELAARFCADALDESYFGWDRQRFASASEHHQLRAESQLAAAESLLVQEAAAGAVVREAFAG